MTTKRLFGVVAVGLVLCLLLVGIKTPMITVAAVAGGMVFGITAANLPLESHRWTTFVTIALLWLVAGVLGGFTTQTDYGNNDLLLLSLGLAVGVPLGAPYGYVPLQKQTPN